MMLITVTVHCSWRDFVKKNINAYYWESNQKIHNEDNANVIGFISNHMNLENSKTNANKHYKRNICNKKLMLDFNNDITCLYSHKQNVTHQFIKSRLLQYEDWYQHTHNMYIWMYISFVWTSQFAVHKRYRHILTAIKSQGLPPAREMTKEACPGWLAGW